MVVRNFKCTKIACEYNDYAYFAWGDFPIQEDVKTDRINDNQEVK